MAADRKILFADPDPDALRAVAPALRERGFEVHAAADGSRALEAAILRTPDLVVYDARTPLLDPATFVRILRSNPRTAAIPVLVAGAAAVPGAAGRVEHPYDAAAIHARAEQLLRRAEVVRDAPGSRDLEGSLAQLPLPDLLQILGMNRKSGLLRVTSGADRFEIVLAAGQAVDARAGAARGEKALFRLLARGDGQFSFHPGEARDGDASGEGSGLGGRRVEELLLEGLRQADELARLDAALPPAGATLSLATDPEDVPRGLQPVTEEVVRLLSAPRSFGALLDAAAAPDLEVARAVAALLEQGSVLAGDGPPRSDATPFLSPDALHALRLRVARGGARGGRPVGKVVVAGGDLRARQAALTRLAAIPQWQAAVADGVAFGTLGTLELGSLRVDLVSLPGDRSQRPLWVPFSAGAVGALVLLPAEGTESLLLEITRTLRLPVAVAGEAGATVPAVLRGSPGAGSFAGRDVVDALRALLSGEASTGEAA
jgi:CheY-like chemotaxis protein